MLVGGSSAGRTTVHQGAASARFEAFTWDDVSGSRPAWHLTQDSVRLSFDMLYNAGPQIIYNTWV